MRASSATLLLCCLCVTCSRAFAKPAAGVHQYIGMELPAMASAEGAPVLNPACIPKYFDPLLLPPVMPKASQGFRYGRSHTLPEHSPEPGVDATTKESVDSSPEVFENPSPADSGTTDTTQTPRTTVPDKSSSDSAIDSYASSLTLVDKYRISAREVTQRVLPNVVADGAAASCPGYTPGLTKTFGYGTTTSNGKSTHNWPAFTIEARRNRPIKVKWVNELFDLTTKKFKKHLLKGSIDQTIHWANPAGKPGNGPGAIDSSPCMTCSMQDNCANDATCVKAATQASYEGPVPLVTHVHGNDMAFDFSDGYPEAWFMPDASNLGGFTPVGTWYDTFKREAAKRVGDVWTKGSATFTYLNLQKPTQLWYHDHVIGLTRLNVYAGLAGLYQLREVDISKGPELPGMPWPPPGVGFPDSKVREVPIVIQDRVWDINSQLFYPKNDLNRTLVQPNGPVPPKWIPELLGVTVNGAVLGTPGAESAATMVVNGNTWPKFNVTREPYRLRLLNGCNARTLSVYLSTTAPTTGPFVVDTPRLDMYVIGNEAGFFPSIVGPVKELLLGPAERYDVIVDFSQLPESASVTQVYLLNQGPEVPFNGVNFAELLSVNTAQVMRFDVQHGSTGKTFAKNVEPLLTPALKAKYTPIAYTPSQVKRTRKFTLVETADASDNVIALYLGQAATVNGVNVALPKFWSDPVTTNAEQGVVEDWEMINLTVDSHPIHIHENYAQIVSQKAITVNTTTGGNLTWSETGNDLSSDVNKGTILSAPCTGPLGRSTTCTLQKDTYLVPPGSITTFRIKTSMKGVFPWNCHLLEHEDNEMMRPWCIGQPGYKNPKTGHKMCPGPPGVSPL